MNIFIKPFYQFTIVDLAIIIFICLVIVAIYSSIKNFIYYIILKFKKEEKTIIYCKNCGAENFGKNKECYNCGAKGKEFDE